ncbi:PadR family transcriptional regulator [Mucilaginibacter sp. HMF5004]|uniref:PadR family transcriptional regulator n=1 Tax=Mucilaginibacter rivuli TaxID=2857527 RepID=UPI001C5F2EF0|nr:PadR family transcriptional regulator [Mucilaginibacter rivuli]MBW4890666.1 PadR family transcriptional regulator [Mucilaginibacter rivuli]
MNNTELLKGTLGTIILKLLEQKGRMYGYEMVQQVKELSGDKVLVKEGSLYPALHKLVADELLTVEEEFIGKRVRKYYSLTPKGKVATKESVDELLIFLQTIHNLIANPQYGTA